MKCSLLIGRYQPLHAGHIKLIRSVLGDGKNVCIGLRNTGVNFSNPYTIDERIKMFEKEFELEIKENRMCCVELPDIQEVCYGRNVGWGIREIRLDENIESISATKIRAKTNKIIWFTGLPCSGKTTLGKIIAEKLDADFLDGDVLRDSVFSKNVGFSYKEREAHLERTWFMAKMLKKYNNVVCCFVSPYEKIRKNLPVDVQIFIKCPQKVCWERDVKGMYAKARRGEIENFTGYDAPYDIPNNPDLIVETDKLTVEESVEKILKFLKENE